MYKHGAARALVLAISVAVLIAASFVVLGTRPQGIISYYRDTLTTPAFIAWLLGLTVATLSPPSLAIGSWFCSRGRTYGWVFHVLLWPVSYAIVRGAIAIMVMSAGEPDSEGLTGWASDPAVMLMLLCPLAYFVTLAFVNLWRRKAPAIGD
ncbi:hypothetical protein [Sphingomonas dokdonensis]|uniref:hypothetical protein n=1 Tax=Sphingomonas dokdonensis TaxID=344880 RepID=UPI000B4A647C|nr:hypothetical protein [Sphingomonas dokdonensis]